jgi:phage baseplate assembly protein W
MAQVFSAEKYTSTSKKLEYYSDFGVDLNIHPGKKDITRLTNEDAVKRAVRNLILTNTGERLFAPGIGANINRMLFELADNDSLDLAQDQINSTLRLYEPRIQVNTVTANLLPDDNTMSVTIKFSLINTEITTSLNLILYRVR